MKKFHTALNSESIAAQLQGEKFFRHNNSLNNVAELSEANDHSICFYSNPRFLSDLKNSAAGLILVPLDFDLKLKPDTNILKLENPYLNFMLLVKKWLELDAPKTELQIASSASLDQTARIGLNVSLGENCLLEENVSIDENSFIDANVVIKKNVSIGKNCRIYPNVTIYEDCRIGDNVIIHAGAVIGADGFGYLEQAGIQHKIPQVGNVIIMDDVEIGANTTIDRATLVSTIIGRGTKIDNLVQVGHNCIIGENCIICAQVGLAGSTIIGDGVYLAGQVGAAGHLKIDDKAMVGAQSGVANNVAKNAKVFGTPAIEAGLKKRILASEKKIPEMVRYYNKSLKVKDQK